MSECGDKIKGLRISELVFGGDGVARLEDGAIVFVPFAAVGDVVTVQITEVHKNFYRGEIVELEEPGPGRTAPLCKYFGACGGCAYQHLEYEEEAKAKKAQFASVIKRIGHFDAFPELEKFVMSPNRYGYRNKLRLEPIVSSKHPAKSRRNGKGTIGYGFCERDNNTFFSVASCALAKDAINNEIKNAVKCDWARQNATRPQPFPMTLRLDSEGRCATYFGFASSKLSWLHEKLFGQDVSVPVGSFWQVNPEVAEQLLATMRTWLEPLGHRTLIDAYAGVGTFSLALGDLFQYRMVIESDAQAVTASKLNHEKFGLKAKFTAGKTEDALGNALSSVKNAETVVLLDPPRTGCLPRVIKTLLEFKPAVVAYVSCNPSTLARDLRMLCENGDYKPVHAAAFDMFPATAHFESAVLLEHN